MKNPLPAILLLFIFSQNLHAQTLNVPADYPTIQAAIDASSDGDTVLVQPGEYFENLRFNGKSIVLTSRFFMGGSAEDIAGTIINGSLPAHPDTASCILIVDGESPSTVVQGFTLTGGKGARWLDPHGAGIFTEGGGILTEGTSPVIQFNIIRDNVITNTTAVVSNGGGGIRCGDGGPVIRNNWIHHNAGRYGGGIVLNYCTGRIYNNVVSYNEGGQDFGGAGLWFTGANTQTVVEVFNNTIVHNKCMGTGSYGGKGGGIFVFSIKLETRNNIIWGNTQATGGPIAKLFGGVVTAEFSDIQGGYTGQGNFDLPPLFADTAFFNLTRASPCVDAANENDTDVTIDGLDPISPSLCGLRGDIGAYGGPWASTLPTGVEPITRLLNKLTTGALVSTPSDSRSVNFVDVNGDGWEDVFMTNGPQGGAENLLYLNGGPGGQFAAVTSGEIVNHVEPFDGATFADVDNDGSLDAFAVTWYGEKNFLYFGNGDGAFTYDATAAPSIGGAYSETASWGDMDNDGDLDLYVTNSGGNKKNLLFRNDGGRVFVKVTDGPQSNDANTSRSVNWTDFDGDGDLDLFVSNEENQPDDLYENDGAGVFAKITGSAAPSQSNRSTMSSSWGDVDNDGDLDLFVANAAYFSEQNNQLFLNENGVFTEAAGSGLATDGGCSYGSNFGDVDNDGDLDLIVSNGYCTGNIVNFLYQNDGHGHFTRDLESIENLSTPCSYGAAWGDVNNDGFLDLGIATCKNSNSSPLEGNQFFLNAGNCNRWLKVKLAGARSNRSAIGAKIWVTATIGGQEVTQLREISAQSGYCGQNSLTAHFGLGDAEVADEVRVEFLGGADTTLSTVPVNQLLEITEATLTPVREIAENEAFAVSVSPNPASEAFRVDIEMRQSVGQLSLRILDIAGKVAFKKELPVAGLAAWSESFSVDKMGLGRGIYWVEISGYGCSVARMIEVF
ncbi:MAG: VCBS repeat-containing protein [Phaeodactylibacter sp.]|nr:VCBS repeat-containing protein [Phaeodactylibacter sp.]